MKRRLCHKRGSRHGRNGKHPKKTFQKDESKQRAKEQKGKDKAKMSWHGLVRNPVEANFIIRLISHAREC